MKMQEVVTMDGIRPYAQRTTDDMLSRTMEDVGDHDPTALQNDTGEALHFDATRGADLHREGLRDAEVKSNAIDAGMGHVRDKAIEKACEYFARSVPVLGAASPISDAVIGLGEMYLSGIEKPHQEGDLQRALGASDAGVVALAQALDFEPCVKAAIAEGHPGSSSAAAAMAAALGDSAHAPMREVLQLRADKGFVDAAGYAKMAAAQTEPLLRQSNDKLNRADKTPDPSQAARLRNEAAELSRQVVLLQNKYMAPIEKAAHADAAYGLGVQRAMLLAVQAQRSQAGTARFDSAFAKANANVLSFGPQSILIQG